MKIYVASSWKNAEQPAVVERLREDGHEVFDFKNPPEGKPLWMWKHLVENPLDCQPWDFIAAMEHADAKRSLAADFGAMKWADAIVAVQPFGRSASIELGWGVGAGKRTAVLLGRGEAELMLGIAERLCFGIGDVLAWLRGIESKHPDAFSYDRGTTPPSYVCARCAAKGVRLYRGYQTSCVELTCTRCTEKLAGKQATGNAHELGWFVAAVPCEDGSTYWGYTSVPQPGVRWWDALPVEVPR